MANRKSILSLKKHLGKERIQMFEDATFEVTSVKDAKTLAASLARGNSHRELALFELLVNGIEHGNLGISHEEKAALKKRQRWRAEINRRVQLPENRDKFVRVDVKRRGEILEVLITDEGSGFDFKRYFELPDKELLSTHGRGVFLASRLLEIEYRPPGNQVRVQIPIEDPAPAPSAPDQGR